MRGRSLFRDEAGQVSLSFIAMATAGLILAIGAAWFIKTMVSSTVGSGTDTGQESLERSQGSGQGMEPAQGSGQGAEPAEDAQSP